MRWWRRRNMLRSMAGRSSRRTCSTTRASAPGSAAARSEGRGGGSHKKGFCRGYPHPTDLSATLPTRGRDKQEMPQQLPLQHARQHAVRRLVVVEEGLDVDDHLLAHFDAALDGGG